MSDYMSDPHPPIKKWLAEYECEDGPTLAELLAKIKGEKYGTAK